MLVIGSFFEGHWKGLQSAEWFPFGMAPHRWKFSINYLYLRRCTVHFVVI